MNFSDLPTIDILGLIFLLVFIGLLVGFTVLNRRKPARNWRALLALDRLRAAIGLAVESGKRLHLSLGRGNLSGMQAGSALVGLSILERITRPASISDKPPVATSGDSTLGILSQDTMGAAYKNMAQSSVYQFSQGRVTGLTPFSYAASVMPIVHDEQIAASILAGHFGPEVALITDASEQSGGVTIAGSDDLTAQAVLYATAHEPLIGEELYVAGAYLNAGDMHSASLRAQDILRWVIIAAILIGAGWKFIGSWL